MKARYPHNQTPRTPAVPVHRGPQAMAHIAPAPIPVPMHTAPNAALLIDFDNVTMGIRSDLQTELRNLLSSDIIQGKVAVQRAYADWRRYPQYIVPLSEASIDLIFAPAYGSSKKNATDIRLAIDALELVFTRPEIGTFILLSGDSDFSSLVIKLKEYGKYVIGVGIRESSSDLLVQNCDEYYSYNALAGLVKSGEVELTPKWDPWELAAEAIGRMQRGQDVMRSDRLKQVMQEIDASFDEKDIGFSKFSKFCQEASRRGLIRTTKLENGQLEVSPADGGKAAQSKVAHAPSSAPAAPAADAPAAEQQPEAVAVDADASSEGEAAAQPAKREGRARRGGRGGRGRRRPGADEAAEANSAPADAPVGGPAAASSAPEGEAATGADEAAGDVALGGAIAAAGEDPGPRPRTSRGRRSVARAEIDETIGVSGVRLTRDEAMNLVRGTVEALVDGEDATTDEAVRRKARELLDRDSESLSVHNFARILRDAHDSDLIDLRRRGDGFEVARPVVVAALADQLEAREEAAKAAEASDAPAAAPVPRGMAPRGATGRNGRSGGRGARRDALPPELLMVGVVETASPAGHAAEPAGNGAAHDAPIPAADTPAE
ncbi:MAG: NYN domain-containing protein [Gemmatimonadaceae bacterium]|nr:NYN domain-containing protein [Gemmatimonadaceae bacterium]